jgi:RNase adapter protein RapZ
MTMSPPLTTPPAGQRLILVTGPSGAGRSTSIHALEDLGVEAIDNIPLSLVPRLLDGPPHDRALALGIDVRNRDFSIAALADLIEHLREDPAVEVELLYLDCRADVLVKRFSETRRRHPLSPAESLSSAVDRERDLLAPIRDRADILIDTSDLTPHDLRSEIAHWFEPAGGQSLAISVQSFSYKRGVPRGLDMILDCRFLRNPHWDAALRPLDGRDEAVGRHIAADSRLEGFFQRAADLVDYLLPAFVAEGKAHLSIGFGCTGGQHRSVYVAERLAQRLAQAGWQVSKRHRELERHAPQAAREAGQSEG